MIKKEKYIDTLLMLMLAMAVLYWRAGKMWLLPVMIIAGLGGLSNRAMGEFIHTWWMKLAEYLGAIMSRVLLSVIFYIILLPVALLSKLFSKKDLLNLKKGNASSCYVTRNHVYEAADMEHPW
jgi:hypothetical protein